MNERKHNMIAAGIRGFICASLATAFTASLSWSFIASTDGLNWMGSDALNHAEVALLFAHDTTASLRS